MQTTTMRVSTHDGPDLFTYRWLPDSTTPRAVVQIAHGMAEHAGRYARLAEALTGQGYAVYAHDHRGHGATAMPADVGYFADEHGFFRVAEDIHVVTERIREEQPGLPVVLLGHSMGSFLSRAYAARWGDELAGLVISGTAGPLGPIGAVGRVVAGAEARLRGRRQPSHLMQKLSFGGYNAHFTPTRTDYDWLSRDEAEVDAYIADPLCGQTFTTGFYADLLEGLDHIARDTTVSRVPRDLPVLFMSGAQDPVGNDSKGVQQVVAQWRRAGVSDLTETYYPGARHELFNETNRDEVTRDLIAWLDAHLPDTR